MRISLVKLHISILLAGLTAIFGKLITLPEGVLVWYRMALTAVLLAVFLLIRRQAPKLSFRDACKVAGVGMILGMHWVFFYASIKHSNISIGVICFSLNCFFVAILEPLWHRHRISFVELGLSLLTLVGIALIFHLDTRYRLGITLGTIGAALFAIFTIANKGINKKDSPFSLLFFEMLGGTILLSVLMPFYLQYAHVASFFPDFQSLVLLFVFAFFCTLLLNILMIQALKDLSPFTVGLSYNLEPLYSILIAIFFFGEARELGPSFYAGLFFICLSVLLQTRITLQGKKQVQHIRSE